MSTALHQQKTHQFGPPVRTLTITDAENGHQLDVPEIRAAKGRSQFMTATSHFSLVVVELMAVTAAMVVAGIQYDWFSAKAGILIRAVIINR
jgi:hypothetical protein